MKSQRHRENFILGHWFGEEWTVLWKYDWMKRGYDLKVINWEEPRSFACSDSSWSLCVRFIPYGHVAGHLTQEDL